MGLRDRGKDWEAIGESFVFTRSVTQIRTHAQKFFAKTEQGLPFPEEPYMSAGGNISSLNPGATASTTITPNLTSDGMAAAAVTAASPVSHLNHSNSRSVSFESAKGLKGVRPPAPQESPWSLPPLGLCTELMSHILEDLPSELVPAGDLEKFQLLGDEWNSAAGNKGMMGAVTGASVGPSAAASDLQHCWMRGNDQNTAGTGATSSNKQHDAETEHHYEGPGTVLWKGYAPGGVAGDGPSGYAP